MRAVVAVVTTYDAKDVKLTFKGLEFKGYMDGAFIEVAGMPPVPRARSLSRSGTVTLTLKQVGGDNFDDLMSMIDRAAAEQGFQVQSWNLAKMIKRAIRRWRRKKRMALRRKRGRGATSA